MTGLALWIDWRPAAGVLAVAALVLAVQLWVILPASLPGEETSEPTPREPSWLLRVVRVCVLTVLVVTASHVPYTLFAVMAQPYGFHSWSLGGLQTGFGGAGLLAVAMIGRQIDRSPDLALVLTVTGLVVAFGVVLDGAGLRWLPVCALLGLVPVAAVLVAQRVRSTCHLPR